MSSFRDSLGHLIESYYALISILLHVALVMLGVWLHAAWGKSFQVILSAALLLIVGCAEFYIKKVYDKRKALSVYGEFINELLEAAALSVLRVVRPQINHIRVSIMFPDSQEKYLLIRYAYGFAPEDKDIHIRVMIGTGCAGQSWVQRRALVADLTKFYDMPKHWGLPAEEVDKIRPSLKSVFAIPINSRQDHRQIAMLVFDSDNIKEHIGFNDPTIQKIAYCFATAFANVIDQSS
jgi:hypothetical protein